ncbi:16S rRNA (guanine(527)-N(7))-methyltransferase RsmG [Sulfurospirillum halorespirans]|uniref:Ribosomal RNA small subunit methyltransferase G n=1 Tax=Sulfurospirillum halorespirans DSM 13726 TaxID=1193502 RepID=A0A1D7TH39_9BACT|nr:16S rRNA (guanine(527)-N(7))-methyltransferase RsmG [Sulfurospirillum halorespirans]AOO64311.1 16S rRNA (guanine527-N7)-methyltransferase [Sulfurospirillum halorespirans DSM 13726]
MAAYMLPDTFWQDVDLFSTLLLQYNQTHNISGAKSKEVVLKNVDDSIYPLQYLHVNELKRAIDIGTGAGFPGLLLALALPHVHFTLFEPIAKKSAFLHLAKTTLELKNVDVSTNRVEKVTPFQVDLISSRAVTNTKMLVKLCQNFIDPSTTLLFYKGELVDEEIQGLKNCQVYQRDKRYYLVMKDVNVN